MSLVAPDPPLAADGVLLRVPDDGGAGWITTVCNDPEIARFAVAVPSPSTEDDARLFLEHAKSGWESGTEAVFVIADTVGGEVLGLIALEIEAHDPALASIGYWLRAEARGRGAATAAVRLVARWTFDELGVRRLQLTTSPENTDSLRVAERAGFTREGVLRRWMPTKNGRATA